MRRILATAPLNTCRFALAAVALAAASLAGCFTEGGGQISMDRFTYVSTPFQPKTISLVDTRTFEAIWSVDVPVGQQVALQFFKSPNNREGVPPDAFRPDIMRWSLMKAGQTNGDLTNAIAVPDSICRRLEMKLRPAPEQPDKNAPPLTNSSTKPLGYNDEAQPEFKKAPPPPAQPAPPPPTPPQPMPADQPVDLPPS